MANDYKKWNIGCNFVFLIIHILHDSMMNSDLGKSHDFRFFESGMYPWNLFALAKINRILYLQSNLLIFFQRMSILAVCIVV